MHTDFQTKENRLKKTKKREYNKGMITTIIIFALFIVALFFALKEVARTGAEYQCARLTQQFEQSPEHFFITPVESKMCPELKAPVKTVIN